MSGTERETRPWTPGVWAIAALTLVISFAVRVGLIHGWPGNFSFDSFQRWAGRDHVLIQDWLPATQAVVWAVARSGGGLADARMALAFIGAIGAAASVLASAQVTTRLTTRLPGAAPMVAAIFASQIGLFGPALAWSTVLYQEGTFLSVFFLALVLALDGRLLAADVVMGGLGLVRYEGWPVVALYVWWRRDKKSLRALWGAAVWLTIRAVGPEGFRASPVSFADWDGISGRFGDMAWFAHLAHLGQKTWVSGGWLWLVFAGVFALRARGERTGMFLGLVLLSQVAATLAWMTGLEAAVSRMMVMPISLASVMAAPAAAWVWARTPWRWVRGIALVLGALFMARRVNDACVRVALEVVYRRPEQGALMMMKQCPTCVWWVDPIIGMGTRLRHDGCEAIQGLSELRSGEDFWCALWVPDFDAKARYAETDGTVEFSHATGVYVVTRHPRGSPLPAIPEGRDMHATTNEE